MRILFLIALLSASVTQAQVSAIDTFQEGWYGTNSYACGRNVIVNRPAKKIYLEITGNPVYDYDCNNVSIPVVEAKCPDSSGQNCKSKNNSKVDILSDTMFVLTSPNGEQHIYRYMSNSP